MAGHGVKGLCTGGGGEANVSGCDDVKLGSKGARIRAQKDSKLTIRMAKLLDTFSNVQYCKPDKCLLMGDRKA
jgi:hypothetical protein